MNCIVCEEAVEPCEKAFVVGDEALHFACYDRVKENMQEAPVPVAQFSGR